MQELTKDLLATRDIVRQNTQRGEEVVKIEIGKVSTREGFNVRTDYGNLQELADSILENGQAVPARVDALADGTFLLTDGHRRFEACKILEGRGHEVLFKAIVNSNKTTEEERILQMFTTQDNKPLLPIEVAELLKRMVNLGHDQTSIAKKIGKSITYVSQMISVANESVEVKNLVREGKITTSAVLKVKSQVASQTERTEMIKQAVVKSEGKKITDEDVTNKKANKVMELAVAICNKYELTGEIGEVEKMIKLYF